jgi:hypothetical protein
MSIELPGWAVDAFNLIGLPWPGIDEDQLRAWASDLRAYAAEITALAGSSRSMVAALPFSGDSSFGKTLAAQWGHRAVGSELRGPMEVFAGALDIAADAVEAQKIAVIGAAVVLAGELIATQGEALFTFGLAEAEVPAEVAIARLAVKAALQELEGQLLGMLIGKAAAEISTRVGGTIGKLISGGGQVVAETVTLTVDYDAMQTLSTALSGKAGRVEQASSASWRKAASGKLDEGGPGGGWREVALAVEQAVLQVLEQLFVDLARAVWTIINDTVDFLKRAIAALRHTDDTFAAEASRMGRDASASLMAGTSGVHQDAVPGEDGSAGQGGAGEPPTGRPLQSGYGDSFDPAFQKGELGPEFSAGVFDPKGVFTSEERTIAHRLAQEGWRVDAREADHTVLYRKNPDAMVRKSPDDPGSITEFKTLKGPGNNALKRNINAASDQSGPDESVVIDGRGVGTTHSDAEQAFKRALRQPGGIVARHVHVILGDGGIIEFERE